MSAVARAQGRPYRSRRWRSRNGLMVPTAEAVAEALETIPYGAPWSWAALRVLPTIRGQRVPFIDDAELETHGFRPLAEFPTVEMSPGIDVAAAIEVEVVDLTVDQTQLDRWDMSIEQVMAPAMANLRRTVGTWAGNVYTDSTEGIQLRMLSGWPQWAVNLLLLPQELQRIFGSQDQLFIAPFACNLISLPIEVDRDFAADLIDIYGTVNPRSLLLGMPAFALRGGELTLEELPGFEELPGDDVVVR